MIHVTALGVECYVYEHFLSVVTIFWPQGQEEVMDLLQAAPFQNMYPRPFVKEDQSAEMVMQQMDQQYAPLHLVSMVSKHGTQLQAANAKDSDLLTKERLCRALSMFEVVMQRMKGFLMKNEEASVSSLCYDVFMILMMLYQVWVGPPPANGVMSIDECQEFHRLWSGIQFAYCMPPTQGQITIESVHNLSCSLILMLLCL